MAARRTSIKKELPEAVRTQALAAVGMLGVTPMFGSEDHMMKLRMMERLMEDYKKLRCAKCKKPTPLLGLKENKWICKTCYVGPKVYTSNEE